MKLNHLDLQVSNVQRSVALFELLLGLQLQSSRTSPAIAILTDGEGFTLVLQRRSNETDTYPDGFHFGFLVPDTETVHRFRAQAKASGLVEPSDVIENGRGVLVYFRTWDGILVEVSCPRLRAAPTPT